MTDEFRLTNRKPPARFENNGRGTQGQLFSRGVGDKPGQRLLFDPLDALPGTAPCQRDENRQSAD